MSFFYRAALRVAAQQPARALTAQQGLTRAAFVPSATPVYRAFHQTIIPRANQSEPSAEEQENEIVEKSVAEPESASLTEKAKDAAGSAMDSLNSVASAVTGRAPARASTGPASDRVLYVGNLLFEVTIDDMRAQFSPFGEVTNVRIVADQRGLSKGFGYIEFANPADAARAIQEMDQQEFKGRRMSVQAHIPRPGRSASSFAPPRGPAAPSKTLFIGNMSYQMSDRDLNDLFRDIRDVLDVRVAIDRRSGQPRGFAHADFINIAAAERAKEVLEQKSVYGRQLRIDFSASSKSGPPRSAGSE